MPAVKLQDFELEYEWIGPQPGDKPTLVFLHEGLGSVSAWKDFPKRVVDVTGLGALVYSRRGYGKSSPLSFPWPTSFMHDEALSVLPAMLDTFNIKKAILYGHSDGGSIALIYAGSNQARVEAVIAEAAHVFVENLTIRGIVNAKAAFDGATLRTQLERYHGPNVDNTFRGWSDVWLRPEFLQWNIESFLPNIKVPVLVIQGEADEYGTLKQVDAIKNGCGSQVESLIIPECGHDPHREHPALVAQATDKFINRLLFGAR